MKIKQYTAKIKIKDTVYGFRVPQNVSKDLYDIINKGVITTIRVGIMRTTDASGAIIGRKGTGVNKIPLTHEVQEPDQGLLNAIKEAIQRSKRWAEALEKTRSEGLPSLVSKVIKGSKILTDGKRYYIESVVYCGNCKNPIKGTQTVHINSNGKVESTDKFVPSEPAIPYKPGSTKWLHPDCGVKNIPLEDLTVDDAVEEIQKQTDEEISVQARAKTYLCNMINDKINFTAEQVRGAADMYFRFIHKGD